MRNTRYYWKYTGLLTINNHELRSTVATGEMNANPLNDVGVNINFRKFLKQERVGNTVKSFFSGQKRYSKLHYLYTFSSCCMHIGVCGYASPLLVNGRIEIAKIPGLSRSFWNTRHPYEVASYNVIATYSDIIFLI